jgi:hypothetical protein
MNVTMTVTVTVNMAAELPWSFLRALCCCAPEECKALLRVAGSEGGGTPSLPGKLHRALQHTAKLLQETATKEIFVSGAQMGASGGMSVCCCCQRHPANNCCGL